jgi:hypothetical protein
MRKPFFYNDVYFLAKIGYNKIKDIIFKEKDKVAEYETVLFSEPAFQRSYGPAAGTGDPGLGNRREWH